MSYKDILDLIKKSDFTLLGYTSLDERIKDEIISNFNYVEIKEVNSSFSFKSFLRDLKLESILESKNTPEYILLDLSNIRMPKGELIDKPKIIRSLCFKLKEDIYSEFSGFPSIPHFKIILTTCLYKSGVNSEGRDINNFKDGPSPIYTSDLVLSIFDKKIKIIKNRFGNNGDEILYNIDYENNYK